MQSLVSRAFVLSLLVAFGSCATPPEIVSHAFSFDAIADSPDIEVLDYRYGDSKLPTARNPERMRDKGTALQSTNIIGPMRRGDSLYVKWRVKDTGQIFEDTVDLGSKLPRDITNYRIHFIARRSQLYVYLVSPKRRAPSEPPNGPDVYDHLKTITIYP